MMKREIELEALARRLEALSLCVEELVMAMRRLSDRVGELAGSNHRLADKVETKRRARRDR